MNHRTGSRGPPLLETERELVYDGVLPDGSPRASSEQLLESVGLGGAHSLASS